MYVEIEAGLSAEDHSIRERAHKFAAEVLRPTGMQLDRLEDPVDLIAQDSPLWSVHKKYHDSGMATLAGDPASDPVRHALRMAMINEELAWGDVGLAITLGLCQFHQPWIQQTANAELLARYCSPERPTIGCWALTEPDHGSDTVMLSEPHFSDPALKANCRARKDGDEYVINGQKAAWVSNAGIADIAVLFCSLDPTQGFNGGGVFLVPLDLPGVTRPKPLDKLGQRSLNQGEIFFDDVRIPAGYMVVGPEFYALALEAMLAHANAAMGQLFVGVARAAYENAREHADTRQRDDGPRAGDDSTRARLFDMFAKVEAARSLTRRIAVYNAASPPLVHYSIATKVFCTNTAFEVASEALHVIGSTGVSRADLAQKLFRDARASMIEDGCNEVLSLVGASRL